MTNIKKLEGREKIQWVVVANKINEIIDYLNKLEERLEKEENEKTG